MRSKKAFYNILFQFILEIITLISSLILPRLILSNFGSEYNGLVASITQFLDFISVLTLGVAGCTRLAIYKADANEDKFRINQILKTNQKFMHKISFCFLFYIVLLCIVFPFLNKNIEWINVVLLVLILSIGSFSNYCFGITFTTFLSAKQCLYISYIIEGVIKLINIFVTISLVYFTHSILLVQLGSSICFAFLPILINLIVKRKFNLNMDVPSNNDFFINRKDIMGSSIANTIDSYTDVFLLTFFANSLIVSVYSIYQLVINAINKFSSIFTNGMESVFGNLWERKDYEQFTSNFKIFEFLIFCLIAVVFTSTGLLILPFICLYTKNVTDVNYYLPNYAIILVLANSIFILKDPYKIIIQATGKYKETKKIALKGAIINVVFSTIGIYFLGLFGIMLGTFFANLYGFIHYVYFSYKNLLNENFLSFIKRVMWLIITVLICIAINLVLLRQLIFTSWLKWVLNSTIVFLINFGVVFISSFLFYKNELKKSFGILKNMIRRN